MNTKDNLLDINKKLDYIGLDLNNIPDFLKEYNPIDYRPNRNVEENNFKVYKYVNIQDIKILLTPTNRLSPIAEKYAKAAPICAYLDSETKENIERHVTFLSMLNKLNISEIEKMENDQKLLKKRIPFKIKYDKNYLWQIYYSEYTDEYFMLVPTEDLDYSAFFYVLKKQLENTKDEKIFVPISYMDYTKKYLKRTEINDIENYLWYFTREWPNTYEVFDKDGNLSVQIVGKTHIYDMIESDYNIKLENEEESKRFYKLVKALFALETTLPHHYKFRVDINKKGDISFSNSDKKIKFSDLAEFVKSEYIKACEEQNSTSKEKTDLENELNIIRLKVDKLDKEYSLKEKQIATFLECKRTFFGRVKYFFSKRKNEDKTEKEETPEKVVDQKKLFIVKKENYTLEDLIYQYDLLDKEIKYVKTLKGDIEAGTKRIEMMEVKVRNARAYLDEIDEHRKSIFDFWKFTNQNNVSQLTEGKSEEKIEKHLKKSFDYELDFEDFAKKLDKNQRNTLTKKELDSIFLLTTLAKKDINTLAKGETIAYNNLAKIKEEVFENSKLLPEETFDIFGSFIMSESDIKNLDNEKHREANKDIAKILDISPKKELNEYKEDLENALIDINNSILKIRTGIEIPVYKITQSKDLSYEFSTFNVNANNAIKEIETKEGSKYFLHKINLKEDTNILGLTNSVFYDNAHKTLPLGMNVTDKIVIKKSLLNLKIVNERSFNIVEYDHENDDFAKVEVKTINVIEYECEKK